MIFRNFNAVLDFLSLVTTRYTLAAPVHFLEMSSKNDVPKLPFEPLKKPHYQSLSQQQRKRSYLLFSKNQEISHVHLFLTIFLAFYTWIVFIFLPPFPHVVVLKLTSNDDDSCIAIEMSADQNNISLICIRTVTQNSSHFPHMHLWLSNLNLLMKFQLHLCCFKVMPYVWWNYEVPSMKEMGTE